MSDPVGDVAALFGVSLKAVDIWWTKWQAGGRESLVTQPRGKPVGVHQVLGEAEQATPCGRPSSTTGPATLV
ncbi:helix-turn-helix domain-containing protein [Streptomyces verrucosisporus]|uniref:helix-turn-helix domain-containing protein n=1 Tax=Streptomyces verrucosisporus TaxID=1695161 RepID=UPI0027DA4505|nr:helix-turn-helix domain-containing protein [Streptomyces verrucosisporus]